ncbi:DNA recombination protein RmuC [Brachybacterium fresconis]|uniref:DNA recombination protein RmuC n=1 Tax=Brachybacterium fresconis TaxID=173363 RepID=A0ABS4YI47_9MICO|nr:DNA recombination protein RmuC [Brachybacterium fresconis]MBP2408474.1 DNA recombination protein RmuC [Brachybacterium fresconis]
MSGTQMLLLGLILGAALGAVVSWLVMRERARSAELRHHAAADSSGQLLRLADERHERDVARRDAAEEEREAELQRTLAPITATLSHLERSLARSEAARGEAEGALRSHLAQLSQRAQSLETGTSALTAALRAPTARGRWGEVQLRRIVEAAGMLEHVDFTEQLPGTRADGDKGQRPDLVVHLAGDRHVVIDAKAPMDAYLDATEEADPQRAAARRTAHAKALRHHVGVISSKAYWKALGDTPEFTVLFVPSDGVLAAALETDPVLLEDAFGKDVVIASPATLVALLRTVAHTWRTDALNRDARAVLDAGRELHHRLGTFTSHLSKVGRSLDSSVAAFNDAVGSLQSRVMVTARRFEDLGLTGTPVDEVEQLTRRARTLEDEEIADLASPPENRGDGEVESEGSAG